MAWLREERNTRYLVAGIFGVRNTRYFAAGREKPNQLFRRENTGTQKTKLTAVSSPRCSRIPSGIKMSLTRNCTEGGRRTMPPETTRKREMKKNNSGQGGRSVGGTTQSRRRRQPTNQRRPFVIFQRKKSRRLRQEARCRRRSIRALR